MTGHRHVEVYGGADGFWRFRLVAGNGEKQTASQPYRCVKADGTVDRAKSKWNATRGARTAHPGVRVQVQS